MSSAAPPPALIPIGSRVEVHSDFDHSWAGGFAVADHHPDGYLIRRRSDGEVLPVVFAPEVVRREHRSMWWV